MRNHLNLTGRVGVVLPSGIATDDTTKEFFADLIDKRRLVSLFHFENEGLIFPGVHHAFRFCLLTMGVANEAAFVFYARQVSDLNDTERRFTLSSQDFKLLNPNTKTCPTFRSRHDAEISKGVYRRTGVFMLEGVADGDPWGVRFLAMLHMSADSGEFRTHGQLTEDGWRLQGNRFVRDAELYLPLIEAKMFHQFDHRFGTYEGQTEAQANQGKLPELDPNAHLDPFRLTLPGYWVSEPIVRDRVTGKWAHQWLIAFRNITGTEKRRTMIAAIIPFAGVGHSAPLCVPSKANAAHCCLFVGNLGSFALDYAARQKVGGTNLTYGYLKQFPVIPSTAYAQSCMWAGQAQTFKDWLLPRVLELTYTAWDLEPFAQDCGYDGPPFHWDEERRFLLRCELDAAFFHLYGITNDDAGYIMDTFPIVRRKDQAKWGSYRTKDTILEIYAALAVAQRTGQPYKTPLDPPPADPRCCHPPC